MEVVWTHFISPEMKSERRKCIFKLLQTHFKMTAFTPRKLSSNHLKSPKLSRSAELSRATKDTIAGISLKFTSHAGFIQQCDQMNSLKDWGRKWGDVKWSGPQPINPANMRRGCLYTRAWLCKGTSMEEVYMRMSICAQDPFAQVAEDNGGHQLHQRWGQPMWCSLIFF